MALKWIVSVLYLTISFSTNVYAADFSFTSLSFSMPSGMTISRTYTLYGRAGLRSNVYIPTTGGNFPSKVYCMEYDVTNGAPPSPLPTPAIPVTFRPSGGANWGILGGRTSTRSIQITFTVPSPKDKCEACIYLCINSDAPHANEQANEKDNNWACQTTSLSCDTDVSLTSMSSVPTLYEWKSVQTPYYVDVKSDKSFTATTSTDNFVLTTFFSDKTTASCEYTTKMVPYSCTPLAGAPNITTTMTSNLKQGLTGGKTVTLSGTVNFPALPAAICGVATLHVCTVISNSTDSTWGEMITKMNNNIQCRPVNDRFCTPDPMIDTPVASAPCLIKGKAVSLDFIFDITNNKRTDIATDTFTNIPASTGGTNFAIVAMLTSAATIPPTSATTLYAYNLTTTQSMAQKLDTTNKITPVNAKASNVVITDKCKDVKYVCFLLKPGTKPTYAVDFDLNNNHTCTTDDTLFNDKKICDPDLSLTISKIQPKLQGVDVPISDGYPVDLEIDFSFKNVATNPDIASGNNVIAPCGAYNNYKFTALIINKDLTKSASAITCSSVITNSALNATVLTTIDSTTILRAPIPAASDGPAILTNKELTNIRLTPEDCLLPKYVCICVEPDPAAGWTDFNMTNNFDCKVIKQDCGPSIGNLPNTTCIYENVTGDNWLFTIEASDPDDDLLTWHYFASPMDDSFYMDPANSGIIKYRAKHKINYEKIKEYKLHVMVTDSKNKGVTGTLNICIKDSNDLPKFHNLPATVTVPENQLHQASIFQLNVTDEDNDPIAFNITSSQPKDGVNKFTVDRNLGVVYVKDNAGIDYEYLWDNYIPAPSYKLNITACDNTGCTAAFLNVSILDVNEPPFYSPNKSNHFKIKEPATYAAPCPARRGKIFEIRTAGDVDSFIPSSPPRDPLSYSLYDKKYVNEFYKLHIVEGRMTICEGDSVIDYESTTLPRIFYIDIVVTDSGFQHEGDKKGIVPLSAVYQLKVYVQNICETPYFTTALPQVSIPENTPVGTTVAEVVGTDADLWLYGEFWFTVDPTNNASKYFETRRISRTRAALLVKSPIDSELYTTFINVPVRIIDYCNKIRTGTVKVTVLNVNDNAPVFNQTLYNWEVSTTAAIGTFLGHVSATDADNAVTSITYNKLYHAEMFSMNSSSGMVDTLLTPMLPYHKYVLYTVASDNDPKNPLKSLVSTIRIDTYVECEVLTSWYSKQNLLHFNYARIQSFLMSLQPLCNPCLPRLHNISEINGKAVLIIYFLKDGSTEVLGNIGRPKEFLTNDTVLNSLLPTDLTPYEISNVTNTCPVSVDVSADCSGLLCSVFGQLAMGFLLSVALTVWLGLIVAIGLYFFPTHERHGQRLDTPFVRGGDFVKKVETVRFHHPEAAQGDLVTFDFRYSDNPTVARRFLPEVNE
ncbi:uncharacterized protein LOC141913463 [Tubulanus polymorphus]|uniref:uncharacterized protein LOC141913463 n=1 Tax=Tubulanus polymorphus TaxID=672921 RepID=UPI003DA30AE0